MKSYEIHSSHNVSVLMYQFVFPTKYRRVVIDEHVDKVITETCIENCKIMNDTLAWDLTGNNVPSQCIDIDPDCLYGLEYAEDPIAV